MRRDDRRAIARTTTTAALAAACLLLASCGGDDAGDGDGSSSEGGFAAQVGSGQDVADMVGCTGFTNDSEEAFVTEGGRCELDGEDVGVYYFADPDAQGSFVEVGANFGGNYLVGDGWAVDGPPAVLEQLQREHGGDLSADQ